MLKHLQLHKMQLNTDDNSACVIQGLSSKEEAEYSFLGI